MSCFSDKGHDMIRYNLKMKVLTFAKVKNRLLKVVRGGPLNGTFLSSILILTFAKNGKSPDLFWKSPEKFCKSQSQNRKIGVRIPSNLEVKVNLRLSVTVEWQLGDD